LHYGQDKTYRPSSPLWKTWNYQHQPPGADRPLPQSTNTLPDLATAMKYNPDLRILLTGGYFDLATPYYEGWYEMHHLQIPERLQTTLIIATTNRATWCTPTRNRSRPFTMTWPRSSIRPITSANNTWLTIQRG